MSQGDSMSSDDSNTQPTTIPRTGERFWATLDVVFGALIAGLAWRFIPIATARLPVVPILLISLGIGLVILGVGSHLCVHKSHDHLGRRWVWRLNVGLSMVIVLTGTTLLSLCLASGLYWLGVFGVLGWGVFISALLLISGVIQLLILYPLLKLRRILSSEYRLGFKGGGVALLLLKLCLVAVVTSAMLGAYAGSLTEKLELNDQSRDLITAYLRATLEGSSLTPARDQIDASGHLSRPLAQPSRTSTPDTSSGAMLQRHGGIREPLNSLREITLKSPELLYVSFYAGGQRLIRVSGRGHDLVSATQNAARALASHPRLRGRRLRGGRLVVDRALGHTLIPLTTFPHIGPLILSLSVDPGRDGLRATRGGSTRTLLASDLVEAERFAVAPIIPGIPELRFGLDAQFVAERLGALDQIKLERIHTEQWVERIELNTPEEATAQEERLSDLPLNARPPLTARASRGHWNHRGTTLNIETPRAQLLQRREAYRASAHLAGQYLIRHQNPDGRFDYQYFPYRDEVKQPTDARYSVPRHAGAIYGLSMLYRDQPKPEYASSAKLAISWLAQYAHAQCGGWTPQAMCIPKVSTRDQIAKLGDSALSALALLTYLEVTEDLSVEPFAQGLVTFLLRLQRADGDFHHKYLLYDDSIEPRARGMFASEQAAFALVLAAKRWPEGPWRAAAERALDALTIHKYEGDFLSSFFYGADHWTCLAAHAAASIIKKSDYLEFCLGYARFLQRLQYRHEHGEGDLTYHGHYGFGFLSPPQAPATGGFTEGVMGALLLAEAYQIPSTELQDIYVQVLASVEALAHDQITTSSRWNIKNFTRAEGAFRRSLVESEVRVDFVQHSLSALLMTSFLRTSGP